MDRMRKRGAGTFAAAAWALAAAGCAHVGEARNPGAPPAKAPVIGDGPSADPLTILEQELARVRSERVTVSASLLRSLVRNQRIQQTQCKNISGQLEALKNIDLSAASPEDGEEGKKQ